MKNITVALILALFLTLEPVSARAEVEDGDFIAQTTIWPLLAWVSREMGVPTPPVPAVVASRSQFRAVLANLNRNYGRAQAVFASGRIIMDNRLWDEEDPTQRSILLHELVHYVQSRMRPDSWACSVQKEAQAYTLQNKWLEEQGHSPFVSASWIRRVSSCGSSTTMASNDD